MAENTEIPAQWLRHEKVSILRPEERSLPVRPRESHKGDFGKVLVLGGSVGYTGAVSLCAQGAVRAGAGLVAVGVPEPIYPIVAVKLDAAMPFPMISPLFRKDIQYRLEWCDVCVLGPGMGRSESSLRFAQDLIEHVSVPMVVDADALFALSRDLHLLKKAAGPRILTPHEGEFQRLGGTLTDDRVADARKFMERNPCTLVLKGHRTVCAFPDGSAYVLAAGNPGMAKGGSGDVLAGVLGGMLGQLPEKEAVLTGVSIHAAAGDRCAAEMGEYGMTPVDLLRMIPYVEKDMTGR